jgi:peptide/nickel transport system substrate-binding protein
MNEKGGKAMKRIHSLPIVAMVLVSLVVVGCSGAATPAPNPTAPPAPAATQALAPTTAPAATQAPVPTNAPVPTSASAPTSSAAAVSRPLVIGAKTEAITLDPHQNDYDYSQKAQHGAYESLLNYVVDKNGTVGVGPGLATSYQTTDSKVWTLTLRSGVNFTDGTPFNADAVKYNFDRVVGLKNTAAGRLPSIDKVEVVDPQTVRITLKQALAPFSEALVKLYMVSPTAAKSHATTDDPWGNKWLSENAVGTGPYLVQSWVKGQSVTMVKNPNYWGGWQGNHVNSIILRYVPDNTTRRLLLESGDVDIAEGINFDDLDALSKVQGVVVKGYNQPSVITMKMRLQGPLKDINVRKAMVSAFDYDGFIQGVLSGKATNTQGIIPAAIWAYDNTIPPQKQDMAAAKKFLAQSAYPNGGFTLLMGTISTYGWYQPREAQLLQSNLKDLNINLNIQDFPDAAPFIASLTTPDKGPDIYAWTRNYSFNDPESELNDQTCDRFPENGGTNYQRYCNPKFDALKQQAVSLPNRQDRFPLYQQIQRILLNDANAIYSANPLFYVTMRDSVQGYVWNPFSINTSYEYYDLWLSK